MSAIPQCGIHVFGLYSKFYTVFLTCSIWRMMSIYMGNTSLLNVYRYPEYTVVVWNPRIFQFRKFAFSAFKNPSLFLFPSN